MFYKIGISIYRACVSFFFNIGGVKFLKRKYLHNLSERKGIYLNIPENPIWIHAVSVGEVQSASALIRRMKIDCSAPCVISTVTETGHDMAEKLLSDVVDRIIYSPFDAKKFVTTALNNIKPVIYISMETELWPEILSQLHSRNIPIFLANGRISDKSFRNMKRTKYFWQGVLADFTSLMVRFDEDKAKFLALGVPEEKITVTGDCKVDALLNRRKSTNPDKFAWLKKENSPLLVAGSTHQGEDEIVISAFRIVKRKYPDARLIIVPRHPERALMTIACVLPYHDLRAELLSKIDDSKDFDFNVIVIDKIGILFDLYAIADSVFVGGSLVEKGGQNPFEPALFGRPAIHGPCMTDFPDTERMDRMGAAKCVNNDTELAHAWEEALEPERNTDAAKNCEEYFKTLDGAAEKTWNEIKKYIPSLA